MADLYNPIFNRNRHGNFAKEKNFTSVVSATGGYFLEDEVNEMQAIMNDARREELKQRYHSGIIENKGSLHFQNDYTFEKNMFSMDSVKALINGNIMEIRGSMGNLYDKINEKVNNIKLPEPPTSGYRYDFVYLEFWGKEVNGYRSTPLWSYGNENNYAGKIVNDLIDERINGETCRRTQMQWQIRCVSGVDFTNKENGFDDMFENGKIIAKGSNAYDSTYSFWRSDLNLDGNNNFADKGLWVAGNGDMSNSLNTTDGYSYAIPLFKVFRRNSTPYETNNIYGGPLYGSASITSRPDGKYSDIIYQDDVKDLRIYTVGGETNYQQLLNRNFTKLLTNSLTNNYQLTKEYFGIDSVTVDATTLVHLCFNDSLVNDVNGSFPFSFVPRAISGGRPYEIVPSACGNGIMLNDNEKLSYSAETDTQMGRISSIYKLIDIHNKDLWTIHDANNNDILACSFVDGNIIVYAEGNPILSCDINETTLQYNEFCHIAVIWSLDNGYLYLVVNGKVVKTLELNGILPFKEIKYINIGYNPSTMNYCSNVIIDDFEYSYKLNTTFTNLPQDFIDGNAKISIDTQKGRRTYTNSANKSILTKEISTTSSSTGTIDIDVVSLPGSLFTNMIPKLYQNNESSLISTTWTGLGTDHISCTLDNMGTNVDYNFILIYELQFDANQGCCRRPEQMFKLLAEKSNDEFFCVRYDKHYEAYNLDRINYNVVGGAIKKPELYAYNISLNDKLGFGCLLKYYVTGISGRNISIDKNILGDEITHIYDVNVYDQIDKSHLIETFRRTNSGFIISLKEDLVETDVVEILIGLNKNIAVYDNISCGINNLYSTGELKNYGDGHTKEFLFYNKTRIVGAMSTVFDNDSKYVAYVNNMIEPVEITFKDTFVVVKFKSAPVNKSDISIFVNQEYDPLRSERLQVWYNSPVYESCKDINYIKSLNGNPLLHYDDYIYAITEGLNYSADLGINKNNICSTNLPTIINVDSTLVPTKVLGQATNVKGQINYIVYNDIDFADNVPVLNELSLKVSTKKINRGYAGYVTVDNKSLHSSLVLSKNVPHLNVFPFLIKDNSDKILMGVITTYNTSNQIYIDAGYDESAFDIFELDKNIIIKGGN